MNFMKQLLLLITVSIFVAFKIANAVLVKTIQPNKEIEKLEAQLNGKIGAYAIDTNNNQIISYRASELFPVQSTLKLIGVAALLKESEHNKNLLREKIYYTNNDLTYWHPVTGKHVKDGMTLKALAEAAITYSDNPAINLIMKKFGGPKFATDFGHSIGNKSFNAEHYDGELNSNPEDSHDMSTPKDMAMSVKKLTLGNILKKSDQVQLITWMKNNTAGYKRIRAGVPFGWTVADKTGSGEFGVANDIGILWSLSCKPIVLAIYTIRNKQDAKWREDIIAKTTGIILNEFAKNDPCFKKLNS